MYTFYVWLYVSASQGHLQATHFLMESTAFCPLLSIILVGARGHYSQFWCYGVINIQIIVINLHCGFF
jgi:hypothetical protein